MNIQALLTFYFINSKAQFADRNINEEIANSMIYVIEKFFVPHGSSIIIIMSFERENTKHFYKDLSAILFGSYDDVTTQIVVNEGKNPGPGLVQARMKFFNMLVIDSLASFLTIDIANKVKNYDTNEFYHIFLHNRDRFLEADIRGILSYCWSKYIINVNVVVQTAGADIIVYTYFPFSESHCNKVVPVEINRFKNGAMVNSELFPQKLQNMYNCPIRVAPLHSPPFIILDPTKKNQNAISGFEGYLLRELSNLMNFSIEIILPLKSEGRGLVSSNHSTGVFNMLFERKVDMSLGLLWFTAPRSELLTASDSHSQTSNVAVLVKNSLNYNSPHLLWFPFENDASFAIIISFVFMLSLIYILEIWRIVPVRIRPRNRFLNFVAWTLGLPSHTLPLQTSKRIFAMTWIVFGLVIRSLYAGIIFHLLRNNLFRKNPTTISEVVSMDYTVVLTKDAYNALIQTSIFSDTGLRCRTINLGKHDKSLFHYLEKHPQEKLFAISPLSHLLYYIGENRKAGVLTILKEILTMQNVCIYFSKHSFLVDRVNMLIQRINAAGLLRAWIVQSIDFSYLKSSKHPYEIVIGQRELIGIYYVWLAMMMVAVGVFCLERASKKFKFLQKFFNHN